MGKQPRFDSLARLAHLDGIASAKHQVVADLSARIRTARDDANRLRGRLAQIEGDVSYHGTSEAEIKRLTDRITEIEDGIARLDARLQAATAEFHQAGRTRKRALDRARELGLPVPVEILRDSEKGAMAA